MARSRRRKRGARGVALIALLAIAGITALVLSPPGRSATPDATPLDLFQAEPDIRALLRTLRPGQSVQLSESGALIRMGDSETELPGPATLHWNGQQLVVGNQALRLPATLGPREDAAIGIDENHWPGSLRFEPDGQALLIIAQTPLEEYLVGVVVAEMGPSFAAAALEAQAIACRSYAAVQIAHRKSARFDVDTTQLTQVWRGSNTPSRKVRRAVEATLNLVLAFEGRLVEGVFSATCGGSTRSASEAFGGRAPAPLRGVACQHCASAPFATWSAERNAREVAAALGLQGTVTSIGGHEYASSGRLSSAVVHSASGPQSIAASRIRRALGAEARSTWFTQLRAEGALVIAEGRGFGHGVGLCQNGAGSMAARSGWSASEILAHYYPGARIARLYLQ